MHRVRFSTRVAFAAASNPLDERLMKVRIGGKVARGTAKASTAAHVAVGRNNLGRHASGDELRRHGLGDALVGRVQVLEHGCADGLAPRLHGRDLRDKVRVLLLIA